MCRPIRNITEAKGYDASTHILACFGGAGVLFIFLFSSFLPLLTSFSSSPLAFAPLTPLACFHRHFQVANTHVLLLEHWECEQFLCTGKIFFLSAVLYHFTPKLNFFSNCVFAAIFRFAGILSAYGLGLANLVYESQVSNSKQVSSSYSLPLFFWFSENCSSLSLITNSLSPSYILFSLGTLLFCLFSRCPS